MPIHVFGGSGDAPFNRTFFNVTLGDVLHDADRQREHKLTLFLTDGTTLEVCAIDELADQYLTVRAYQGSSDGCELAVNLIPYALIYRIEISPKGSENDRVGFRWAPPTKKSTQIRRR